MMKITIVGATGRVGQALLEQIKTMPELTLVEAISQSGANGTIPLNAAQLQGAAVIVDFSNPAATMALLDHLDQNLVPVVVGTTGFDDAQAKRLQDEGGKRAILVGANFTKGFEGFAAAADLLARAVPDANLCVGEIYNAQKKPVASGTTKRLCQELGRDARPVETDIQRIKDTPGVNTVTLEYGVAQITLELSVHSRAAYAAGALEAAAWLRTRGPGFYRPKDMLL